MRQKLYVFQWPSNFGGADTKLVHTLRLWSQFMDVTVVPNDDLDLLNTSWTDYLASLNVKWIRFSELPNKLEGYAIAFTNDRYIEFVARVVKERGLHVVWGNEMMWLHEGELDLVRQGIIDTVLYTSDINRKCLSGEYERANSNIRFFTVGNYIDADSFPYRERHNEQFTIGRLSRPDPDKYPEDFPLFYEMLGLKDPLFRVMAWSDDLKDKYRWHNFGSNWHLLGAQRENTLKFLHSLDLFVYPLGHKFTESWGRSTVEAMLTGCVVVVPSGHNFPWLIKYGETGFICETIEEYQSTCKSLQENTDYRRTLGRYAAEYARDELCNMDSHLRIWKRVFNA